MAWLLLCGLLLLLLLLLFGSLLLSLYKLRIVNKSVTRCIVHLQNGINQRHQLFVREYFLLHMRLLAVGLLFAALLYTRGCRNVSMSWKQILLKPYARCV